MGLGVSQDKTDGTESHLKIHEYRMNEKKEESIFFKYAYAMSWIVKEFWYFSFQVVNFDMIQVVKERLCHNIVLGNKINCNSSRIHVPLNDHKRYH